MRRVLITVVAAVTAVLVAGPGAGPAAGQYGTEVEVIVTPSTPEQGSEVTVDISGCPPNTEAVVAIGGETVGTGTTDDDGELTLVVQLPPDLLGTQTVAVTCGDASGSTTITIVSAPDVVEQCSLATQQVRPGDTVIVTLSNVPAGERVRILFNDQEVASGTAPGGTQSAAAFTVGESAAPAVAAQAGDRVTLQISFQVPATATPGTAVIRAVGETFQAFCGDPDTGLVQVLSATDDGTTGSTSTGGTGGAGGTGSTPRTGTEAAQLAAIGTAALAGGALLVHLSRRRRQPAAG